ncbi:MAG: hypothetical protein B6241_13030 [Spirochaetaceae bacterium 4572_59]|nr:MAG: hypothetical protein B6241_13030 [Spirochaetaceae bacterium 4572_59]
MKLNAKWIWNKRQNYNTYNDAIIARKCFSLASIIEAQVAVSADSYYRLKINGQWVNDGPARGWPEHYQYDLIDISSYLVKGENSIEITARYFGVGDFHRVCQQAGLLAQLEITGTDGQVKIIGTDASWKVCDLKGLVANTPKLSVQQSPYELYNANMEGNNEFLNAIELFDAHKGPWKGLHKREVKLLTREAVPFKSFMDAKVVSHKGENYCFPAVRLMFPGAIETNSFTGAACGFANFINVEKETEIEVWSRSLTISVNGKIADNNHHILKPGKNLLLTFIKEMPGSKHLQINHEKERSLRISCPVDYILDEQWSFIPLHQYSFLQNDINWSWTMEEHPDLADKSSGYSNFIAEVFAKVRDEESFSEKLGPYVRKMDSEKILLEDHFWKFSEREVLADGNEYVNKPGALIHNNSLWTTINPSDQGDIELSYDLGEQRIGYFNFDIICEEGLELQISGIENIAKTGEIQHSNMVTTNLNGMTYITREGLNQFTSYKRRSGRFIFLSIRNQNRPLKIRHMGLIESTYPVDYQGSFRCSDNSLTSIWDISARTLKLCMEDTFTDCPLYEQTLWVGDARNEALFAYPIFGSVDIARNSIDLAGQSLERYPIVGCQVPSAWDSIIPIWSFLWVISIWDHYWYTGDSGFVKERYHQIIKNLKGAEGYIDKDNLFSAAMWNLFDWAGIDQDQRKVLYNSQFFVGAIEAAHKCGELIGDRENLEWLESLKIKLIAAINKLWDYDKKSYPDSIRDDGTISPQTCQHTSFLSLLYNISNDKNRAQIKANTIKPLKEMTTVGSPFAILYLYEALEKIGADKEILESIHKNYLPMLESGATTVWETFPGTDWAPEGALFPTRSHAHAWSSAPAYFLNRIILGIRQSAAGGEAFTISPQIGDLNWASGSTQSAKGRIEVMWERKGPKLSVRVKAPAGVKWDFVENDSMKALKIDLISL